MPLRLSRERGAVTAEMAMVLPLLLAVTVGMVWLVSLGVTQVRVVDAAREAARAAARGDPANAAVAAAHQVAPEGAAVSVSTGGRYVTATVRSSVDGPGGIFDFLGGFTVAATSHSLAEDPP